MITYQYFTSNDEHQYGNNRILQEIEPFMTRSIRVPVRRTNPLIYALRVMDQCTQRDGPCIHHFTEPSMGFMGHVPTKGKKIISINDAIAPKWYPITMRDRILASGYSKFDAVVTISESAKEEISEVYHIPGDKIHVMPLGVNTERFHPSDANLRDLYGIPKDALVFGTVGNTRRHKNLGFALDVLKELHRRNEVKEAYFMRCGYYDENDRHQRDQMDILNAGYSKNVINLPYQEDLVKFYNTLNVYLAPSLAEGFDLPVLEALACGVSVLASDIPVHQEILEGHSVLSKMDSPDRAGACALLLEVYYYLCLQQANYEFAEQFPWSRTAQRLQGVYDAVASSA